MSLKEAKIWATPNTCSPSLTVGPRVTFSSFSALTFFFPDCITSTTANNLIWGRYIDKVKCKNSSCPVESWWLRTILIEFVYYRIRFMRHVPAFIYLCAVCKAYSRQPHATSMTKPYHLLSWTKPVQMVSGTSCKLVHEDGLKEWGKRIEGMHTMMLELVLREGIGIRTQGAAAANAGKEPYRMRAWRLVAFFKP